VIDASVDNSCQAKSYEKGFLLGYYIEKGARYFWGKKQQNIAILDGNLTIKSTPLKT